MFNKLWKHSFLAFLALGMVAGSPLWAWNGDDFISKRGNKIKCNKNKIAGAFITPVIEEEIFDADLGNFLEHNQTGRGYYFIRMAQHLFISMLTAML